MPTLTCEDLRRRGGRNFDVLEWEWTPTGKYFIDFPGGCTPEEKGTPTVVSTGDHLYFLCEGEWINLAIPHRRGFTPAEKRANEIRERLARIRRRVEDTLRKHPSWVVQVGHLVGVKMD